MQVLNETISCIEEPLYLVVNYTSHGGNSSTAWIDIENCTVLHTNGEDSDATTSYVCSVTENDSCLDEHMYNVRVAYRSGKTHFSDYSGALSLERPSEGVCVCVCVCACVHVCVCVDATLCIEREREREINMP